MIYREYRNYIHLKVKSDKHEASTVLANVQVTKINYTSAWELLKKRITRIARAYCQYKLLSILQIRNLIPFRN